MCVYGAGRGEERAVNAYGPRLSLNKELLLLMMLLPLQQIKSRQFSPHSAWSARVTCTGAYAYTCLVSQQLLRQYHLHLGFIACHAGQRRRRSGSNGCIAGAATTALMFQSLRSSSITT